MKDFDCISVCPQQALSYGFAAPALFRSFRSGGRFGLAYDFSLWEETVAALVFAITVLSLRGLYGRIPFLLSLAAGVLTGFGCLASLRVWKQEDVRLSTIPLRAAGRLTRSGWTFLAVFGVVGLLVLHSAFVRFHEYSGLRQTLALTALAGGGDAETKAATAFAHLDVADRWGFLANERAERSAAVAALRANRFDDTIRFARRYLTQHPEDLRLRQTLAHAFLSAERTAEAERELGFILAHAAADDPRERETLLDAYRELAHLAARRDDYASATTHLQGLIALDPSQARAHAELGGALAEVGRLDEAIEALRGALRLDDHLADATYNLATLLAHTSRYAEAIPLYEKASVRMPSDADVQNNLGFALMQVGRAKDAERQLRVALATNPSHAGAHFNIGMLLASESNAEEAEVHLRTAARLDPRFARALQAPRRP